MGDHDEDGQPGGVEAMPDVRATPRSFVLALAAFVFLFGQPAVVFALTVTTQPPVVFAVIGAGTMVLAASTAQVFVSRGGSVSRLGDFLLTLAVVQVLLIVAVQLVVASAGVKLLAAPAMKPGIVLAGYPVAYYATYRRLGLSPGDL